MPGTPLGSQPLLPAEVAAAEPAAAAAREGAAALVCARMPRPPAAMVWVADEEDEEEVELEEDTTGGGDGGGGGAQGGAGEDGQEDDSHRTAQAALCAPAGCNAVLPCLTTPPRLPPWIIWRLGPLLLPPERRLGISEACRGPRSPPPAAPKP